MAGQLLEIDELSPEQLDGVRQILGGGRHLLDLINEVLDINRIEAGRMSLSIEPVPVAQILHEALDLVRPLIDQRGIRLEMPPQGLCERHVRADRQRLKQIVLNLLSNAVKYNRREGTVAISCRETPRPGLRIEVRDTGHGIPPDKLERLFTPFDRLGAEESTEEGTWLGLALAKKLAEVMGGTLGVESAVGWAAPSGWSWSWLVGRRRRRSRRHPRPDRAPPRRGRPGVPDQAAGRPAPARGPPGPPPGRPGGQPRRAVTWRAARWARAITDSIGLTPLAVGNSEASAT